MHKQSNNKEILDFRNTAIEAKPEYKSNSYDKESIRKMEF